MPRPLRETPSRRPRGCGGRPMFCDDPGIRATDLGCSARRACSVRRRVQGMSAYSASLVRACRNLTTPTLSSPRMPKSTASARPSSLASLRGRSSCRCFACDCSDLRSACAASGGARRALRSSRGALRYSYILGSRTRPAPACIKAVGAGERCGELLDEERRAMGPRNDHHELGCRLASRGPGIRAAPSCRQRAARARFRELSRASKAATEGAERMPARNLVASVHADENGGYLAAERAAQAERPPAWSHRPIAGRPGRRRRRTGGNDLERSLDGVEEQHPVGLPRSAAELRDEYGELPPQRRTARGQPVRFDAQERAKGGDDGTVREEPTAAWLRPRAAGIRRCRAPPVSVVTCRRPPRRRPTPGRHCHFEPSRPALPGARRPLAHGQRAQSPATLPRA